MANQNCWDNLRYFKKDSTIDNWGDPDSISEDLLYRLDNFRNFIGCPIIVTSGVRNKDSSKGSFHHPSKGSCAVDIVIPDYDKSAVDLVFDADRFNFTGLGIYTSWRYKGEIVPGLHLDTRPSKIGARWIGYINEAGKQVYTELNFHNLLKYFLLDEDLKQYLN